MAITRREFIRGGVAAFTVGFAAPAFLSDIARAQGARARNLVVVYLSGGNDALSTVVPVPGPVLLQPPADDRVPAGQVLQIGTDSSGKALGPASAADRTRDIFNEGRLAIVQRTGYPNSSRSHFQGTDIWATADPDARRPATGWLGRYLDTLPRRSIRWSGWSTTRELPRALHVARRSACRRSRTPRTYAFNSPNSGAEAANERAAATRIASHVPVDRPHLAFVNTSAQAALATLDRVASVTSYTGTVAYPNNGFALALRTVAGAIVRGIGTRVFWVQTGGFDTHAEPGHRRRRRLRAT